jgi:cytoskeleton protein RodZ
MSANRPADFGTKLRQARERKGIALREIANRTKISIAVLEALERSDVTRLPGGLFSRAFVRSYAREVGLDPDATVEEFIGLLPQDAVAAAHGRVDQVEDTQLFESDRRVASSVLWILLISVPLAGGVLYLGMHQTGTSDRTSGGPAAKVAPPEAAAPPPAAVPPTPAPPAPAGATRRHIRGPAARHRDR